MPISLPENARIIAAAGVAAIVVGLFAPIMSIPIIGTTHLFAYPGSDWCIVFYIATIIAVISIMKRSRVGALLAGAIAGTATVIYIIGFQMRKADMVAQASSKADTGLVGDLVAAGVNAIQLEWGIALLTIGSACLIVSSMLGATATTMGHAIGQSIRKAFTVRP